MPQQEEDRAEAEAEAKAEGANQRAQKLKSLLSWRTAATPRMQRVSLLQWLGMRECWLALLNLLPQSFPFAYALDASLISSETSFEVCTCALC